MGGFSVPEKVLVELKRHLAIADQLALLAARGLSIGDERIAAATIERLGYYRLSGYFYPLRRTKPYGEEGRLDGFKDGASLALVAQLADFDKRLRLIALDAIEAIEVAIRVAIAHRLGRFTSDAHTDESLLDKKFCTVHPRHPYGQSGHQRWLERFAEALDKSKDDFVKHHKAKYDGRMPIWVAIEIWDFGLLSRFFEGMKGRDQNAIASSYGPLDGQILISWIRALSFIRNISAHHARLWNRTMAEFVRLPALEQCRHLSSLHTGIAIQKIYGALTCARYLLRTIDPGSTWHSSLKDHIDKFPQTDLLSIEAAGFPRDWKSEPIWH